jgi:hypothetical protein
LLLNAPNGNPGPGLLPFPATDLFSAVGWQVEGEDREEGDAHARDDQVDRVEERLPPHRDVESYVQIRLITTSIKFLVSEKEEKDQFDKAAVYVSICKYLGEEEKRERTSLIKLLSMIPFVNTYV